MFRAGGFPSTFSLVYPIVHQRELRPSIVAKKATEKTKNRPAGPNHRRRQGQSQVEPQVNPPSESTSETTSRASSGLSALVWWFTKSGLVWASLLVHWVLQSLHDRYKQNTETRKRPALAEASFRFAVYMLECGATLKLYLCAKTMGSNRNYIETNSRALVEQMDFDVRVSSAVYLCLITIKHKRKLRVNCRIQLQNKLWKEDPVDRHQHVGCLIPEHVWHLIEANEKW